MNRVALPGGEVYRDQKLIVAPFDDDAIQHYSARLMFMSAISIGPLGVIEGDPADRPRRDEAAEARRKAGGARGRLEIRRAAEAWSSARFRAFTR